MPRAAYRLGMEPRAPVRHELMDGARSALRAGDADFAAVSEHWQRAYAGFRADGDTPPLTNRGRSPPRKVLAVRGTGGRSCSVREPT